MGKAISPRREQWISPWSNVFEDWVTSAWPSEFRGALKPAIDVVEDENNLMLTVELPGMDKDDVQITLEKGVLTVSGEKKQSEETKGKNFHRIERSYGAFSRSFTLPREVDGEKAEASYENGVLTVTVPKSEQAKPKTLKIK